MEHRRYWRIDYQNGDRCNGKDIAFSESQITNPERGNQKRIASYSNDGEWSGRKKIKLRRRWQRPEWYQQRCICLNCKEIVGSTRLQSNQKSELEANNSSDQKRTWKKQTLHLYKRCNVLHDTNKRKYCKSVGIWKKSVILSFYNLVKWLSLIRTMKSQ